MRALYTPRDFDLPQPLDAVDFGSEVARRRSISGFLAGLSAEVATSDHLFYTPVGSFARKGGRYRLARYVFLGPGSDDDPIRLGIFAGIHGDEPQGSEALVRFLLRLNLEPERARGYQIFAYPICNPTGFEDDTHFSRSGADLNHEFWQGSRQPEVYYLERELGVTGFHGVISLHTEDSEGFYAHSRSEIIGKALVQPALAAASRFLPLTGRPVRSKCAAAEATGRACHEGVLVNHGDLPSRPFEIVLETPQSAPDEAQIDAAVVALESILAEYRPFLATQQNI